MSVYVVVANNNKFIKNGFTLSDTPRFFDSVENAEEAIDRFDRECSRLEAIREHFVKYGAWDQTILKSPDGEKFLASLNQKIENVWTGNFRVVKCRVLIPSC